MTQNLTKGGQTKGKTALMAETALMQRQEHALEIKILAMPLAIFEQIRIPDIPLEDHDKRLALAEKYAIGLALQDGLAWLLVFDDTGLWRWGFLPAEGLDAVFAEFPWIGTLPQVFLMEDNSDPNTRTHLRRSRQRRGADHTAGGQDRMGRAERQG